MTTPRSSLPRGVLSLAGFSLAYDILASRAGWKTISAECGDLSLEHPILSGAVLAYLGLHLTNMWPDRYDPLEQFLSRTGRWFLVHRH